MSTPPEPIQRDQLDCDANPPLTLGDEWVTLSHCDRCQDTTSSLPASPDPPGSPILGFGAGNEGFALHPVLSPSSHDVFREFRIARKQYKDLRQAESNQRKRATDALLLLAATLLRKARELSHDTAEIEAWQRQLSTQLDLHDVCLDSIERQEQYLTSLDRQIASGLDMSPTYRHNSTGCDSACDLEDDTCSEITDPPSGTPIPVDELFRLEGLEGISIERLEDLDLERREQLHRLENGDASQSALQMSYSSEKAYERRHRTLVKSLASLQRQTEIQRATCLSQGYNPERYRWRRLSGRAPFD